MIDNVFYLRPPPAVNTLVRSESKDIFDSFVDSAPEDLFAPGTGTHQGLYVLDPDGAYLSGGFSYQSNYQARRILNDGLGAWANKVEGESKSIPEDPLPVPGSQSKRGYFKLQISYRDLPRGSDYRPGDAQFRNPYNLGWYEISKYDLFKLVTSNNQQVLKRLALAAMKDSVRGEMSPWKYSDWKDGKIESSRMRTEGSITYYSLEGWAEMRRDNGGPTFSPQLFGVAGYDYEANEFVEFRLVAVGQRSGAGPSNGRSSDKGLAPMGVAIRL